MPEFDLRKLIRRHKRGKAPRGTTHPTSSGQDAAGPSMDSSGNTVDATNLTGQVSVDNSTPQFKGNYSYVYQGVLEGQLVIGFPHHAMSLFMA
jgi:hypothetical protein